MKEPKFLEIARYIKQQIEDKVYRPGEKIPTEMELAKHFNTSRQTVNKALRDLVHENIVERFPRNGTFVSKNRVKTSILDLKEIKDEVEVRGNAYTKEVICLDTIKADEHVAPILNVVKDQKIYISKIVHKENGVPVRFDVRCINPLAAPEYINQSFDDITPHDYLKSVCPVETVQNSIEAVLVDEEMQQYLDIEASEPCLLISRVVTSQNRVASYSRLYYPSARYRLASMTKA